MIVICYILVDKILCLCVVYCPAVMHHCELYFELAGDSGHNKHQKLQANLEYSIKMLTKANHTSISFGTDSIVPWCSQ